MDPTFTESPDCPIAHQCGGCPRMGEPVEAQLDAKRMVLARATGLEVTAMHASPRQQGYRARVSLRTDGQGQLGFFRPRSHDHVPVVRCAVSRPEINAILQSIGPLEGVASVELRSDGARVVMDARAMPKAARTARASLQALDWKGLGLQGIALEGKGLLGNPRTTLSVAGIEHRLGPSTFFQINLEVNAEIVARVVAAVQAAEVSTVLDLYAGAGNLSMPLAQAGLRIIQIESSPRAVADGRRTAKALGLEVDIRQGDAGAFQAGDAFFDAVILDPPRAGAPGVMSQLLVTRPALIVLVSCNPRALGRDLRPALEAGYTVSCLEGFDMFPHTDHLEALAILHRAPTP